MTAWVGRSFADFQAQDAWSDARRETELRDFLFEVDPLDGLGILAAGLDLWEELRAGDGETCTRVFEAEVDRLRSGLVRLRVRQR